MLKININMRFLIFDIVILWCKNVCDKNIYKFYVNLCEKLEYFVYEMKGIFRYLIR